MMELSFEMYLVGFTMITIVFIVLDYLCYSWVDDSWKQKTRYLIPFGGGIMLFLKHKRHPRQLSKKKKDDEIGELKQTLKELAEKMEE